MVETNGSQWTALAPLLNFHSQLSSPTNMFRGLRLEDVPTITPGIRPELAPPAHAQSTGLFSQGNGLSVFLRDVGSAWISEVLQSNAIVDAFTRTVHSLHLLKDEMVTFRS